ncbi:nuclear transport factor 2 family protein [Paraurantiacibacter namhicola]|uniref:SnoaL-like domain protein n=1 Tax=Paraurantiacibacter namhicola TaxID=645517 RepID=A0A1C7DAA3_9SPHN|nr:nuclear transport factor 2 family protein [Paraurantiacibacter namhicola]ANU08384.1 SnoaL-like domain protein [Paraurantiacibacter namhicola]
MDLLGGIFGFNRLSPLELAHEVIRATNARDYEALGTLCGKRFVFVDGEGSRVEGCDEFVTAVKALVAAAPDFTLDIDRYDVTGENVVMHGQTSSSNPDFTSEALWRMVVRRGRVQFLENYVASAKQRLVNFVPQQAAAG